MYVRFSNCFSSYVGTQQVCSVWIVSLFLTDKKFSHVFDFLLFEKMDQRNCIRFCIKTEIKCTNTFEMLTTVSEQKTISIVV